jgi:hypothetical protein
MISLSAAALSVLTGSYRYRCSVSSWLDGELLAADVPVDAATEEADWTIRVPERVTLTVPRRKNGETWAPNDERHPLYAGGQQLDVKLGIGLARGATEWFTRGRFLIEEVRARRRPGQRHRCWASRARRRGPADLAVPADRHPRLDAPRPGRARAHGAHRQQPR